MTLAAHKLDRRFAPLTIGLAILVVYLVTLLFTLPLGHRVLPMFEGVGGTGPYHWVKPPSAFASTNVPPNPSDTDIPMGPGGSELSGAQTDDRQVVINLAPNAVPAHPPDTSVRVHIEPLDPGTLGPVPAGFRANGNAYRVTMTYEPSGTPATTITSPGNILLNVPLAPAGLLSSADGRTWTNIGKQAVPAKSIVGGPFTATGWYLGAAHPQTAPKGSGGSTGVIAVAVLVGVLALALGFFPLIRRRVRGTPAKKKAQPAKKAAKKRRR